MSGSGSTTAKPVPAPRRGRKMKEPRASDKLQNVRLLFQNTYFQCLSPVSLSVFSLVLDLLFDCLCVLEYAKMRTVLQSTLFRGRKLISPPIPTPNYSSVINGRLLINRHRKTLCGLIRNGLSTSWKFTLDSDPRLHDLKLLVLELFPFVLQFFIEI